MSYTASYIVNSSSAQGTTDFQFTFPYIKEEHIEVFLNYNKITQGSGSAQYQVITNVSPKLIRLNTGIASANLRVEVRRNSSLGSPLVDYADGSTLTANDLDTSALQSLYIDQELKDNQSKTVSVDEATGLPSMGESSAGNLRLTKVADPTAAQDAATKNYVDTKVFTSAQIQDGTLVNADVNTSAAIDGTKISPNFGSQNIVTSGTVDGRDVSNDGIKLDSIETGATADQTNAEIRAAVEAASDSNVFTDADHSKLNAIEAGATADQTNAEIRAAVEAASDSNVFTDADHSKLNAIEASATADQTSGEIKTLLQSDKLTASEIADGTITATQIATGALDGRYYTETESDARYFNVSTGDTIKDGDAFPDNDTTIATTAAINDRIIDLVDDVGGFVPIASETNFPTANPDVNNGAGTLVSVKAIGSTRTPSGGTVSISNGSGSNTVTITGCGSTVLTAGFGVIVETTSTLHTYAFHRLVPKATEVTTVAGNISNINSVATNESNINSAVSNASNINSAVSNATNINSVAGNISNVNTVAGNNTNINTVAGANSNISTVATNISNVNNVGGSIANVNSVASNLSTVNDFGARYRVASSDPTSNNDEGDLVFNTTSNELRVYNGSAWQGGVTATGNLAGLGANTFTGNQSLGDNLKVRFGTGNDLELYHNGSHSYIDHTGTGDLWLRSTPSGGDIYAVTANNGCFVIQNASGAVQFISCSTGSVELYEDGVKKFETTSTGAAVTGSLGVGTTSPLKKLHISDAGDVGIALQTTNANTNKEIWEITCGANASSEADLILQSRTDAGSGGSEGIRLVNGGAVKLYYDNRLNLATTGGGIKVSSPDGEATIQIEGFENNAATLQFNADEGDDHPDFWRLRNGTGTEFSIENYADSAWEKSIECNESGNVELYYDNALRFYTTSTGSQVNGDLRFDDNHIAKWGNSQDLQIYHDGSNSKIDNSTGKLLINTSANLFGVLHGSDDAIISRVNGAVELYYDGSKKFETVSAGVEIHGNAQFDDNCIAKFGTGGDLEIYHDSYNNSYIKELGSGNLYIYSQNCRIENSDGSDSYIEADNGGASRLYWDGARKLETTSSGINVIGSITQNGAALGGGVWERFGAVTITSNSSDVDLTWSSSSSIMSDYEKIKFEFYNIKKTSDNETRIELFDTSGNIITSSYNLYKYYSVEHNQSNSFAEHNKNNEDRIILNDQAAGENMSGSLEFYDPFDNISGDGPIMYFWRIWNTRMANATDTNDRAYFTQGAGMIANNAAWDTKICGIRLTQGTYTGGKIVAYGLKNS